MWIELTGLDGGQILVAVAHIVTAEPASVSQPNARTEITTIIDAFYVQQDYAMVRKVLGECLKTE
jgi:hypothetical protein